MGRRDYAGHEAKKPKKNAKKLPPVTITPVSAEVEVIRKKRKEREEEVEEK